MVDELPIGRGRRLLGNANGVLNGIVGGWRLSTILLAQTGPFLTPFLQYDTSGNSLSGFNRPDLFGQPNISNPTPQHWFNPNVFACPGESAGHDLSVRTRRVTARYRWLAALATLTWGRSLAPRRLISPWDSPRTSGSLSDLR